MYELILLKLALILVFVKKILRSFRKSIHLSILHNVYITRNI